MNLLRKYCKKNSYLFRDGSAHSLSYSTQNNSFWTGHILPIVIIGREHYQELEKVYPVADKKDVTQIVANEYPHLKMQRLVNKDLTSTNATLYLFDDSVAEYVNNNNCIFLPETMLTSFVDDGEMYTIERLGGVLNVARKGSQVFSSSGSGIYQNPDMFVLSSGIGEVQLRKKLQQTEYFELLLEQLSSVAPENMATLLKGQVLHRKVVDNLHIPSVSVGFCLSVVLYWLLLFGHLKWSEMMAQTSVSSAEVKEVIQLKQAVAEKLETAKELRSAGQGAMSGGQMWSIITSLLENDVSVGSLFYENGEAKLSLVTASATETVEFLRSMKSVKQVRVDGDIFSFQGKQKVSLVIAIQSEQIND